jgi:hypothetical protein
MPHPDLSDLFKKLIRTINDNTTSEILIITNQIAAKIEIKHSRLSQSEGISLNHWNNLIQSSPEQFISLLQNTKFSILKKRDIEIVFKYKRKTKTIYCKTHKIDIETIRSSKRILLENPFLVLNKSKNGMQSWARPSTLSFRYKMHIPTSSNRHKSRYLNNINIKSLELLLFENAWGLMESENRIFLYGKFQRDVGTLPNRKLTCIVKMQCDRVHRTTGTGTKTEIHSFPISKNEFQNDFKNVPKKYINHIVQNIFPLKYLK